MCPALVGVDVVYIGKNVLFKTLVVFHGDFNDNFITGIGKIDGGLMERGFVRVQIIDKTDQPALEMKCMLFRLF